jgi:dihydrofolate reductase
MRRIVVSEGVTRDGFFDAETMGQWAQPYASEERDRSIQETVEAADALLYGRTTYELQAPYISSLKNNEYGIADRMNRMPKYVVASRPPKAEWHNTTLIGGAKRPMESVADLKRQPGRDILIMGSATLVAALAQAGLIDLYKLLVYPAVIGGCKRFFKDGTDLTRLTLVESRPLSSGVVLLCYAPAR